ncbi:MAG: hypothetical protein KAX84_17195 [Burkholderiales bacterium]|nr:hypothetical protein [Burkholderiales bacterium]
MITIEDFRRMAALAGERALVAALERAFAPRPTRIPADLLRECEHAAGIATADTTSTENRA